MRVPVMFGLAGFLVVSPAQARQAADQSDEWPEVVSKLVPGEYEEIERLDGTRVTGTLVGVSGNTIQITQRTRRPVLPTQVPLDDVRTIRQGRVDTLRDGAFRGLATGAIAGLLGGLALWSKVEGDTDIPTILVGAVAGGIGAGVGAGVGLALDAAHVHGQQLIYSRRASSTAGLRLVPMLNRERRGVMLSMGF